MAYLYLVPLDTVVLGHGGEVVRRDAEAAEDHRKHWERVQGVTQGVPKAEQGKPRSRRLWQILSLLSSPDLEWCLPPRLSPLPRLLGIGAGCPGGSHLDWGTQAGDIYSSEGWSNSTKETIFGQLSSLWLLLDNIYT